jgi:hypothetical protein
MLACGLTLNAITRLDVSLARRHSRSRVCERVRYSTMSALGGVFNLSTQHLLILLEKEVCDGGDCTDMVYGAAEG